MGSSFSSYPATDYSSNRSMAKVISTNGNLHGFPIPVTVSQVLEIETSSCFLSNSDSLLFDDYIPALESSEELQANEIYFVLPTSRLRYRLTAPEMAALAVKARTAISQSLKKEGRRRNTKIRISPVLELNNNQRLGIIGGFDGYYQYRRSRESSYYEKSRKEVSKSGSIKKLQRYSTRRTKLAIRSFQMKLSRVYDGGSVVD